VADPLAMRSRSIRSGELQLELAQRRRLPADQNDNLISSNTPNESTRGAPMLELAYVWWIVPCYASYRWAATKTLPAVDVQQVLAVHDRGALRLASGLECRRLLSMSSHESGAMRALRCTCRLYQDVHLSHSEPCAVCVCAAQPNKFVLVRVRNSNGMTSTTHGGPVRKKDERIVFHVECETFFPLVVPSRAFGGACSLHVVESIDSDAEEI
jgi:hypothetical protein